VNEIRHGLPVSPRTRCILFTRERLDKAFSLWREPLFRCPQCFEGYRRLELVKEHLEESCEYLQGDLTDVQRWARRKPRSSYSWAFALLRSLGY
jgi:hypothetical protein